MSLKADRIKYLIQQFESNQIAEQEFHELFDLVKENENEEQFKTLLLSGLRNEQSLAVDKKRMDVMLQNILQSDKAIVRTLPNRKRSRWLSVAAAAVITLAVGTGIYLLVNRPSQNQVVTMQNDQPVTNDVAPGSNKAILTLADGSAILLDSAHNGALTQQGNTKVLKVDSGLLRYEANNSISTVAYNTLSTPRGGQYQLVLPDGSKVWLNAASSLRYPTVFTGDERTVELTGEAYFEVAHNAKMPFHVKVNDMTVEVLGTHFNINAYNDEETTNTTLLEGSVRVSVAKGNLLTLKPGEQSQIKKGTPNIQLIKNADIDKAMAWKNGWFEFDDTELPAIMRQISRWYDVDVVYDGTPTSEKFGGRISKSLPLSSVLYSLESSGVKFKQDGKKLTVQL